MRVPTVKIRNKKTKVVIKVNQEDWARDLGKGKYSGWERVGAERKGEESKPLEVTLEEAPKETEPEEVPDTSSSVTNIEEEEEKSKPRTRRRRN